MKIGRIFYLIPDISPSLNLKDVLKLKFRKIWHSILKTQMPTGGVRTRYQHCELLNKLGFKAYLLHMGNFKINWFEHDVVVCNIGYNLKKNDIIVCFEVCPYEHLKFKNAIKIMFVQGWGNVYRCLKPRDHNKTYFDLGYDYVISCSSYITDFLKKRMKIDATTVKNGINHNDFFYAPDKKIKNTVLCLTRKNKEDIEKIKNNIKSKKVNFIYVDNLKQSDLIEKYQKADIFLASGYPEGFGRQPLEAMACGCVVVGFTGGGGSEFMIDKKTAMVPPDGDCEIATKKLLEVINNEKLKEKIRRKGIIKAKEYTLDRMQKSLQLFYSKIEDNLSRY